MAGANPLLTLFKEQLENESKKLAELFDLEKRGDLLIWWYFQKLQGLDATKVQEIICDGSNDLGIDAIRIDDNNVVHFYQFKNPENLETALPAGEVDKVLSGLRLILHQEHGKIANEELKARIEEVYQTVPAGYRLHLVTSGKGLPTEAAVKLESFVKELHAPSDDFFIWILEDIEQLQDTFYRKELPTVTDPIIFDLKQAPYPVRSADHDCYLFHSVGNVLVRLYEKFGEQLLQQNIRVFEGDNATNASIRATCTSSESPNFLHFNNGITFLCETAQWDHFVSKLTLNKAQVVNGGQTIRVLAKAHKAGELRKDVLVLVRVITSQGNKDFANDVAVNLNNQNRVESSFLRSNDPRVVQLAHSLESLGWYLERRESELKGLASNELKAIEARIGHPLLDRTIRLTQAAQAYAATYFRQPETAKKNPKRLFIGAEDNGLFEKLFSEITAERVVVAHELMISVETFLDRFNALKRRKNSKTGLPDWKNAYQGLVGTKLVEQYSDLLDQVIPQSAVFLCALLFEDHIRIKKHDPQELLKLLRTNAGPVLEKIELLLDFARANPQIANKSWPTLLKSQSYFEHMSSFIKGKHAVQAV